MDEKKKQQFIKNAKIIVDHLTNEYLIYLFNTYIIFFFNRYFLNFVYFNTRISSFKKGAISVCRHIMIDIDKNKWNKIKSFNIIHPSLLIKTRVALLPKFCATKGAELFQLVKKFKTFYLFLETIK